MTNPNHPMRAGLAPGGLWPAHLPRPQAPGVAAGPRLEAPTAGAKNVLHEIAIERLPWKGVQWTLIYIGLLGYIFTITTYRLPIGDISMACALLGLLTQRERFRMPGLLAGLAVFLLWCMIGYATTVFPEIVYMRLQIVVKMWIIGVVAANALRTRQQIRFFLVFWLACFAFYPVRGAIFNYYVYHETMYGRAVWNFIFANPNDLAAYCILQLSLAAGLLSLEKKGPVKLGTILGLCVVPLVIVLTKSRGAFLGFASFVMIVVAGHQRRVRAFIIVAVCSGIVIAIAPKGAFDRVQALEQVQGTGDLQDADQEGSAYQRYEIWKVARTIIREHPVMGVGIGAYPPTHVRVARRANFDPTAGGRRDTHSLYLNLTAETGFVGLILYVIAYLSAIIRVDVIRRKAKKILPGSAQTLYVCEAGAAGFFIAAVFGSMAHVSFLLLHVVTSWCLSEVVSGELKSIASGKQQVAAPPVTKVRARRAV